MITNKEKGLLHIYPGLAGLTDEERRRIMVNKIGVYTSRALDQAGFELAMAEFEKLLWSRVDAGAVVDPRLCRTCGTPLRRLNNGDGACPEGCERRKVYAWTRDYWAGKIPANRRANSRQIWKLKQLWNLLKDYLPAAEQTDSYLAGIIANAGETTVTRYLRAGQMNWKAVTSVVAHKSIEALKDRLKYATP